MRSWKVAVVGAAILLLGGLGGWLLRARHNRAEVAQIAADALALDLLTSRVHTVQEYKRGVAVDHDADLRCLLYDPGALALPATVRRTSASDGMDDGEMVVELEVDTGKGPFRLGWRGAVVPASGRRCELFGRAAAEDQEAGRPTLLDPGWLEPVGTMARLREKTRERAGEPR
jgi:hypothetical protein